MNIGSELPNDQGRVLFQGSFNADLYAPFRDVVTADDVFCRKTRMSGMWSPQEDLHQYLVESGKQTILFAGINTDQCVLSTLTDAHSWGWDCILLADCTGTMSPGGAQAVAEYNIATCMGFVIDSDALVNAKSESTAAVLLRHDSGVDLMDADSVYELGFMAE